MKPNKITDQINPGLFSFRRSILLLIIVGSTWLFEVSISSGPFIRQYPQFWGNYLSILLFSACFIISSIIISNYKSHELEQYPPNSPPTILLRAQVVAVILVWVYVGLTGDTYSYNPDLITQYGEQSVLEKLLLPLTVGAAAAQIALSKSLNAVDYFLIVILLVFTFQVGGRTVPSTIGLFLVFRLVIFPIFRGGVIQKFNFKIFTLLAISAITFVLILTSIGAARAENRQEKSFSSANLGYYGYSVWPSWSQNTIATLGTIGEAAHVTHAVVPEILPQQGIEAIGEDWSSFLPGTQQTITRKTIEVYRAAGSRVIVSRPGGTHATLYLIGGNLGVAIGGLIYGGLIAQLIKSTYLGKNNVAPILLLIVGTTFVLGAYGTGIPSSQTIFSILVALIPVCISKLIKVNPKSRFQGINAYD